MAGGLTETQRGMLLSKMSDASVAMMLGRGVAWVKRQRGVLADLPERVPVQSRVAQAAKPWRPDEDPFAPPSPPVAVRRTCEGRPQTWREAGEAAVRAAPPVARPEHQLMRTSAPPRRWNDLRRAETARMARATELTPDPALMAEKHHERMFVRAKRSAGVGWFNIANMTGRTVPYLKAQYGEGSL